MYIKGVKSRSNVIHSFFPSAFPLLLLPKPCKIQQKHLKHPQNIPNKFPQTTPQIPRNTKIISSVTLTKR